MRSSFLKAYFALLLKALAVLAVLAAVASLALWAVFREREPRVGISFSEVLTEVTWIDLDEDLIQIDPASKPVRMTWQSLTPRGVMFAREYQTVVLESGAERYSITGRYRRGRGVDVNGTLYFTDRPRAVAATEIIRRRHLRIRFGEGPSVQTGESPSKPRTITGHLPRDRAGRILY